MDLDDHSLSVIAQNGKHRGLVYCLYWVWYVL